MTILDLLQTNGFHPRPHAAGEACSPCPACGGKDRFVVFLEKGRYWCRHCGVSGDAIQFLKDFHLMSFREAANYIGRPAIDTGNILPTRHKRTTQKLPQPALWCEKAAALIEYAHKSLLADRTVLAWLKTERGITEKTVHRFHLGWLHDNHFRTRESWGLAPSSNKLFIPSGLTIPWKNQRVRIRRDKPGEHGRYYVIPGSVSAPMVIGNANEPLGVVVESELDAILLSQEVTRDLFIVALGSAQAKPDATLVQHLEQCPLVLIATDSDEAGAKAARWWRENMPGVDTFRCPVPGRYGKDISDLFLTLDNLNVFIEGGVQLFAEHITSGEAA